MAEQTKSYPAATTTVSGVVSSVPTTVTQISFSDRILVTIVQEGRLAQWLQVPMDTSDPTSDDPYFSGPGGSMSADQEDGLLPSSQFTPKALLGAAAGTEREVLGQLYASQIASAIKVKDSSEKRTLVLGLGLAKADSRDREVFADIMDLVLKVV